MNQMYDEKITRRLFFSMVPVQILVVMCGGVNVIIDTAFAGNLIGKSALAATGLYGPVSQVLNTINVLLFCGAQVLCGKYLGANTLKRARSIFTLDVVFVSIIGAIASVLFIFCPTAVTYICAKPDNPLIPELIQYLKGIGGGVIPYLLGSQLTSFLQMEKKEKYGYLSIAAMFITNCVCDYLFIKVFDMGIYGLGLATNVSNWVSLICASLYFIFGKASFRIDFKSVNIRDLLDIFKCGFPPAGTQLMIALRGFLLNNIIMSFAGEDGMAAFSAIGSFGAVYWAVPAGMTSAMVSLASIYTGEKDKKAVELLLRIYLRRAVLCVLGASLFLSALSYPLTNMYFHDPSSYVYKMTLLGFILFPLSSPASTIIVGMRDLWRCMDYMKAVNVIVVGDGIAAVILFSYIFASLWGMPGIWIAQVVGCFSLVGVIYLMACMRQRALVKDISGLCCFPEDFGVDDSHRLTISVHSMEEVINISELVMKFCNEQGIDNLTSNRAGLCVEELASNIVKHGFTGKANSVVDISVVKSPEELIIKLKDNCKLFNPEQIDAIFVPEDPTRNAGIRIVRKVCKSMEYITLLGLNVLTIKM